ncbi:hypothetical protein ACFU8W_47475 [Streptomyces sp. NPDC057565]|uniref:hypothetical protein n=1 Tax=Streptomyces sp. NPDC057565 TaxID=3346169 RepID=UPI0036BEB8CA
MVTARQKRGAAALSGALTLVVVLAGCGDGDDKPSAAPPAAATTRARDVVG